MSAWNGLSVPASVMKCLGELQFTSPTPIQSLTLPPAINDRLDIVGAAETVSFIFKSIIKSGHAKRLCIDIIIDIILVYCN